MSGGKRNFCAAAAAVTLTVLLFSRWRHQPLEPGVTTLSSGPIAGSFRQHHANSTMMRVTLVGEGLDPWDYDFEMHFVDTLQELVYNASVRELEPQIVEVLETRKVEPAHELIGADAMVLDLELYDASYAAMIEAAAEDSTLARLLDSKGVPVYLAIWDNGVISGSRKQQQPAAAGGHTATLMEPTTTTLMLDTASTRKLKMEHRHMDGSAGPDSSTPSRVTQQGASQALEATNARRLLSYEVNWAVTAVGIVLGVAGLIMLAMGCCVCCAGAIRNKRNRRYHKRAAAAAAVGVGSSRGSLPRGHYGELSESEMAAYTAHMGGVYPAGHDGMYGTNDNILSSYISAAGVYTTGGTVWAPPPSIYSSFPGHPAGGGGTYQPPKAPSYAGLSMQLEEGVEPPIRDMRSKSIKQLPYRTVGGPESVRYPSARRPPLFKRPMTPEDHQSKTTSPPAVPSRPRSAGEPHDASHAVQSSAGRPLSTGVDMLSLDGAPSSRPASPTALAAPLISPQTSLLSPQQSPLDRPISIPMTLGSDADGLARGVSVGPPRNVFTPPGITGLSSDYEQGLAYNPAGGFSSVASFSTAPLPLLREPAGVGIGAVPGRVFDPHTPMGRPIFTPDVSDSSHVRQGVSRSPPHSPRAPAQPRSGSSNEQN